MFAVLAQGESVILWKPVFIPGVEKGQTGWWGCGGHEHPHLSNSCKLLKLWLSLQHDQTMVHPCWYLLTFSTCGYAGVSFAKWTKRIVKNMVGPGANFFKLLQTFHELATLRRVFFAKSKPVKKTFRENTGYFSAHLWANIGGSVVEPISFESVK